MNTEERQLATITDHQINLYYFIAKRFNPDLCTMHELTALGLPKRIADGLNQNDLEKNLWLPKANVISEQFLSNIQQLLNSQHDQTILARYALDPLALKVINGCPVNIDDSTKASKKQSAPLSLKLNKHNIVRLNQEGIKSSAAMINIDDIDLYAFKTGFSVVIVSCHIEQTTPLYPAMLAEVTHNLSRLNNLSWHESKPYRACKTRIGLSELARSLAHDPQNHYPEQTDYSDTYLEWDGSLDQEQLKAQLLKLTQHYQDAYKLNTSVHDNLIIPEQAGVLHCIASEGSATAIKTDSKNPDKILNFKETVYRKIITPLQLMTFYETQVVDWHLDQTSLWLAKYSHDANQIIKLNNQPIAIENFSLNILDDEISSVNVYNSLYTALQTTRSLDRQFKNAVLNFLTIKKLINEAEIQHRQKIARNTPSPAGKYLIAILAFLSAFVVSNELLKMLATQPLIEPLMSGSGLFHDNWQILIKGLISIAAMICAYHYSKKKFPDRASSQPNRRQLKKNHLGWNRPT